MTNSQKNAVNEIKKYIDKNDLLTSEYEYKEWEIEETDYGTVIVRSVVGMVGDEDTMASVFCRDRRQIFIGKRGGLLTYKYNKEKGETETIKGFTDVMIFGASH